MPPNALLETLQAIRRRIRTLAALYGAGVLISLAVGLLLAIVSLDYLLNLPAAPRLLLVISGIGGLLYLIQRRLLRPVWTSLPLSDVAGRMEQSFPQFGDRLRSTVEFARGTVPGSAAMQQRVIAQATTIAQGLDLRQAVITRPAWYSAGAAAAAVLLAGLLGWWLPQYASIAWSRLVSPLALHPWPKRVQIQLLDAVPARLAVGQHFDVRLKLARGDSASRKATVIYQFGDGPLQRELMTRGPDGTYAASLETRIEPSADSAPLKVSVQAGDDEQTLTPIAVVPRLAVQAVIAEVMPPPYVPQQTPQSINLAAAPATLAEGSRVLVRAVFNKSLAEADPIRIEPIDTDAQPPAVAWARQDARAVIGQFPLRKSLRFRLRATDSDGFSNNAVEEYEIIVKPDAVPSIQIDNPRRNEERTAASIVPLSGVAEDDYGVSEMRLVTQRVGDNRQWNQPLISHGSGESTVQVSTADSSADRQRLRVNWPWNLSQLSDAQLKPGDVLEYRLEAKDNFVLGDQTHAPVASGRLRITIISQEDLTSRVSDDLRQIKQQIAAVRTAQDQNRQETIALNDETKHKSSLDSGDLKALQRLGDQQAAAAAQTRQLSETMNNLSRRLDENQSSSAELTALTREVGQQLQRTAESSMKDASQQLSTARQKAENKQSPEAALDGSAERQQRADEQLQQSLERMANIGSLQTALDNLNKLLDAQRQVGQQTQELGKTNLGKALDQMSAGDREKLQQAADTQGKLAQQTAKALDEMQKLAEQMAKSDPSAADALKKAAATGQQQQVSRNQQKAADNTRQNQQSQAQNAQKQAELGLQEMVSNLRQAEQHKLAELQKQLEALQAQIANLVRRQSGHNLDSLTLQGPEQFKRVDPATLAQLTQKADRNAQSASPVQLVSLLTGQEQSESNTREIVKLAEAAQNGAEAASNLTRAAGKMERAIVSLKDSQLAAAYDPSQVDALAALERAKKVVDDQKSKVDEQVAEQNDVSVRDQYAQIRAEQQKLNDQTIEIEKTRSPDGTLNRASAVRLGQLPEPQAKLAERVNKIGETLTAAGSTVYIWSNKDIAANMSAVHDQLAQKQSGPTVQARQTRVVEQLDAMIRNLVTKPKQSKFAQDAGGGGGGGGEKGKPNPGAKLPPESELRLLQDLQRGINQSTQRLDRPRTDNAELADLGSRQAELRGLLDATLQKSSAGKMKLPAEPDAKDQLPEESNPEAIENNELDQQLLAGVPDEEKNDKDAALIGDRMARSRQRLTLNNDPGKVTQAIQEKILIDLDYLIDQARKQQIQQRNPQQDQEQQQMAQPKSSPQIVQQQQPGQANQQIGATPAADSTPPGKGQVKQDLSADIRQSAAEWGAITPRLRDAAIDSAGENVVESYRKLVEDYYRSVARQGAGQQP